MRPTRFIPNRSEPVQPGLLSNLCGGEQDRTVKTKTGNILRNAGLPAFVNYHLNRHCNFKCRYCFATFNDHPASHGVMLPKEAMFQIVSAIAETPLPPKATKRKLTCVGGEPTLCPWLPELIAHAKCSGLVTMLVTNGSRLDEEYLMRFRGCLDWVSISVDSANPATNDQIGRRGANGPMSSSDYLRIAELVNSHGMRLKVNTVVNALNCGEDMSFLIAAMNPERWKLFQAMPIAGQNDGSIDDLTIEGRWFDAFLQRHAALADFGITVVPETIEDMRGSYRNTSPPIVWKRGRDRVPPRPTLHLPVLRPRLWRFDARKRNESRPTSVPARDHHIDAAFSQGRDHLWIRALVGD